MNLFEVMRAAAEAIRAHIRVVILFAVAALVIAIAINASSTTYKASAVLTFTPLTESSTLAELGIVARPPPTPDEVLDQAILKKLAKNPELADSSSELRQRLEVKPKGRLAVELIATAHSPAAAKALANAWAGKLVSSRNAVLADEFDGAEKRIRGLVDKLRGPRYSAERRDAGRQLLRLAAARGSLGPDARVAHAATKPTVKARRINELVALALGLMAGVAAALVLGILDRRLRTQASVANAYGAPVLGMLSKSARSGKVDSRAPLKAAGWVRSKLALPDGKSEPGLVLVTSSEPLEASHRVALELALGYARDGRSTALLVWRSEPAAARAREALDGVAGGGVPKIREESGSWEQLHRRLGAIRPAPEVVILDAPAVLTDVETLIATQAADAWLVCAALGVSRSDEATALREQLSGLSSQPAGVVVVVGDEGGD